MVTQATDIKVTHKNIRTKDPDTTLGSSMDHEHQDTSEWLHGPSTSACPQVVVQPMDFNMIVEGSTDQGNQHDYRYHLQKKTMHWSLGLLEYRFIVFLLLL